LRGTALILFQKRIAVYPMITRDENRGPRGQQPWWQQAVIYQIAPMSFQDSDGDGKGDLRGIIDRLPYLEWLGIDAVWLCPIYPSPMLDFGYDISDYCNVDALFGTLDLFDKLVAELHARGIKLLLDLVPNHTSSRHPWFVESRSSRENPKRDWYVWADPGRDGGPPNNWLSRFGGTAWQLDEPTGQYYYHAFLCEQPDLNWRNGEVRQAMADVLRFWLARGVDGFRVDASAVLIEDDLLRDDPPDPKFDPKSTPPPERLTRRFTDDRPESLGCLEDLRAVLDEFPDRVLAGEVQGKLDRIGHFYGNDRPRFHLPLNFTLLDTEWSAIAVQAAIDAYLNAIPAQAWPDWVIGGHDKPRVAGRLGQAQARILAMLALTLKGTPFFFAGDEIGMPRVRIPDTQVHDIFEKLVPGYGLNRDPERSPMRWDGGRNGGFTSGEPWLCMGDDVAERNVLRQQQDVRSLLWLYRSLIELRKKQAALRLGDYVPMRARNDVLAFKRTTTAETLLVSLNFSAEPRRLDLPAPARLLISTHLDRECTNLAASAMLRGGEGLVLNLDA
jgi:alpha-glucosidase